MRMMKVGPPPRLGTVAFLCVLALSAFGFFALKAGAKVPVQFDFDGWTTFQKRNLAMLMYAGGATLTWLVGRAASIGWVRLLMVGILVLLAITEIAALSSANLTLRSP